MDIFGERLRAVREREGLSQSDVAQRLDVSRNTYLTWEAGVVPGYRKLLVLAELFNVSIFYLLGIRGTPDRPMFPSVEERDLLAVYAKLTPRGKKAAFASVVALRELERIAAKT